MAQPVEPSKQQPSMSAADAALLTTAKGYVSLVRAQLRDYPELNRLVAGQENSDRQLLMAIFLALDDWNATPPLLASVKLANHPSPALLVQGAIVEVLKSNGILQTRNQLTYSEGQGVQTSVSDKGPALMNWISLFQSTYEAKKKQLKVAINLRDALGQATGVSSELLIVNGFFNDFGA